MPEETQNRYQNKFATAEDNRVNSKEILYDKSLIKKAKTFFIKFIKWINE